MHVPGRGWKTSDGPRYPSRFDGSPQLPGIDVDTYSDIHICIYLTRGQVHTYTYIYIYIYQLMSIPTFVCMYTSIYRYIYSRSVRWHPNRGSMSQGSHTCSSSSQVPPSDSCRSHRCWMPPKKTNIYIYMCISVYIYIKKKIYVHAYGIYRYLYARGRSASSQVKIPSSSPLSSGSPHSLQGQKRYMDIHIPAKPHRFH